MSQIPGIGHADSSTKKSLDHVDGEHHHNLNPTHWEGVSPEDWSPQRKAHIHAKRRYKQQVARGAIPDVHDCMTGKRLVEKLESGKLSPYPLLNRKYARPRFDLLPPELGEVRYELRDAHVRILEIVIVGHLCLRTKGLIASYGDIARALHREQRRIGDCMRDLVRWKLLECDPWFEDPSHGGLRLRSLYRVSELAQEVFRIRPRRRGRVVEKPVDIATGAPDFASGQNVLPGGLAHGANPEMEALAGGPARSVEQTQIVPVEATAAPGGEERVKARPAAPRRQKGEGLGDGRLHRPSGHQLAQAVAELDVEVLEPGAWEARGEPPPARTRAAAIAVAVQRTLRVERHALTKERHAIEIVRRDLERQRVALAEAQRLVERRAEVIDRRSAAIASSSIAAAAAPVPPPPTRAQAGPEEEFASRYRALRALCDEAKRRGDWPRVSDLLEQLRELRGDS